MALTEMAESVGFTAFVKTEKGELRWSSGFARDTKVVRTNTEERMPVGASMMMPKFVFRDIY